MVEAFSPFRPQVKEAFELFDTDKDGVCVASTRQRVNSDTKQDTFQAIDYHELKVAMRALGFDLKKAEVLKIMRDQDKHGSQKMEYDEFVRVSE